MIIPRWVDVGPTLLRTLKPVLTGLIVLAGCQQAGEPGGSGKPYSGGTDAMILIAAGIFEAAGDRPGVR
jgi:hypothetical protein